MGITDWFNKEKRQEKKEKRESIKEYIREDARLAAEASILTRKINELDEKMITGLCKKGMTREQAIEFLKNQKLI